MTSACKSISSALDEFFERIPRILELPKKDVVLLSGAIFSILMSQKSKIKKSERKFENKQERPD